VAAKNENNLRKQAERAIAETLVQLEEFDEEEPMTEATRDTFRKELAPLLKRLLLEALGRSEFQDITDLISMWQIANAIVSQNGPFGDEIALGSNTDDGSAPDGSIEFVEALNGLLRATKQPELACAPYLDEKMNKVDVYRYGLKHLGKDFVESTWSCYRDEAQPCASVGPVSPVPKQ
jgi:hypothetical protein